MAKKYQARCEVCGNLFESDDPIRPAEVILGDRREQGKLKQIKVKVTACGIPCLIKYQRDNRLSPPSP